MNIFYVCVFCSFFNILVLLFATMEISTHKIKVRPYVSPEENLELSAWETMR